MTTNTEWKPNYGSTHQFAKLDEARVADILRAVRDGESHAALARRFDVSRQTIRNIAKRTSWRHVSID